MELSAALMAALVAGATAALKDTAGQAIKDAYAGLKGLLVGRLSSLATLEEDPQDEDYQKAVAKELEKKQLAGDKEILAKAQELLAEAASLPPDQLAAGGVNIQRLKAATDVIVKDIEARGDVVMKDIEARIGKVEVSGIKGGN